MCTFIQNAFLAFKVPRVFINGNFVGGGDDTVNLDTNGKLKTLLEDCNAI